jgi:hypothetical protein
MQQQLNPFTGARTPMPVIEPGMTRLVTLTYAVDDETAGSVELRVGYTIEWPSARARGLGLAIDAADGCGPHEQVIAARFKQLAAIILVLADDKDRLDFMERSESWGRFQRFENGWLDWGGDNGYSPTLRAAIDGAMS